MFFRIKKLFSSSPSRGQVRLGLEPFEDRSLPSATVALSALSHLLTVNGSSVADQVQASISGHTIDLDVNGHSYSYAKASISQIDVSVGKGKDSVVNDSSVQLTVNAIQGSTVKVGGKGLVVLTGVDSTTTSTGTLLTAFLTGTSGAFGEVTALPSATSASIVVSGLTADANYTFDIGTTSAGTFTTDSSGDATVTIDNIATSLTSGAAVSILDASGKKVLGGTLFSLPPGPPLGDWGWGGWGWNGGVLSASLTSSTTGVTGQVTALPAHSSGEYNLQINVTGLTANATYTLVIGGTSVGSFVANSSGDANITLNDVSSTIASGTAVTIVDSSGNTDLSGTFSAPTPPSQPWGPLSASLTSTTSGVSGTVIALPGTTSGDYNLQVLVSGLAANTTYTLDIGTTVVGTFVTNSSGAANITLNDVSATVASGTTASIVDPNGVTDLSGSFATSTTTGPGGCGGGPGGGSGGGFSDWAYGGWGR